MFFCATISLMVVIALALLGLCLGSFVNALVWRLHTNKDWVRGRSECTHCHHTLSAADLIPIISWFVLGGKCRYCHKKIEDSPLVELVLPLAYLLSYLFWPLPFEGLGLYTFLIWLVFLVGFLALAVYDLRWFLLPDKIVFPLIALAVVYVVSVAAYEGDWKLALSAASGALVISGLFYLIFQISNGKWIGGGDVKLGVVLGLLAGGVVPSFLLLFVASLAGLAATVPMVVQGKAHRKTQLPFGPFLIAGLIVVVLFGANIIDWYSGLLYA